MAVFLSLKYWWTDVETHQNKTVELIVYIERAICNHLGCKIKTENINLAFVAGWLKESLISSISYDIVLVPVTCIFLDRQDKWVLNMLVV